MLNFNDNAEIDFCSLARSLGYCCLFKQIGKQAKIKFIYVENRIVAVVIVVVIFHTHFFFSIARIAVASSKFPLFGVFLFSRRRHCCRWHRRYLFTKYCRFVIVAAAAAAVTLYVHLDWLLLILDCTSLYEILSRDGGISVDQM